MDSDDAKARLMITLVATIAVMVIGLIVAPWIAHRNNQQVAERLSVKIAAADDSSVKVPLRQLDSLGEVAIEPLIAASASHRTTVATIARQIINEKLAALIAAGKTSSANRLDSESARTIELLAMALARRIHEYGPGGKQWAERLALSMIELTDKLPAHQTHLLLEHCSHVLTVVPPQGRRLGSLTNQTQQPVADQLAGIDVSLPNLDPLTRVSEKSLEHLARIQPRSPRQLPARQASPLPAPSRSTSTQVVESKKSALDWSAKPQVGASSKPPIASSLTKVVPGSKAVTLPDAEANMSGVVDIPPPNVMSARADALRRQSMDALFLRLQKASFYEAGIIRSVLAERGLVEAEIELRLKLESPQAADRLRFLDDISRLPTASASRTFRWLLRDESGEVRLKALTALATTGHPDVAEIARELAINDEDPRVANLASQLLR